MKRSIGKILSCILLTAMLTACGSRPHDVSSVNTLPPIFPDYAGVTIPAEVAPLNFLVEGAERVDVTIKGADSKELHANGDYADFDIKAWHKLTEDNKGKTLTVSDCAKTDGKRIQ